MKARVGTLVIVGIALILTGCGILWIAGGLAGRPVLPAASPNGVKKIFNASEVQVVRATTNAFRLFKYHEMMLTGARGSDYLARGWYFMNGFALIPTLSTLANVPTRGLLGRRHLPYVAAFHIVIIPQSTNVTMVRVRTVSSKLLDGITLTHSGTGRRSVDVPPIESEEQNVILAIVAELEAAGGNDK